MSCPRISHTVPVQPEISTREASRRGRRHRRVARTDSFHGSTPSARLASAICTETGGATRTPSSIYSIPGYLRRADRLTRSALNPANAGSARSDLDQAVEAYNSAVVGWRNYEMGRPHGAPTSVMVRGLDWSAIRLNLIAAAEQRGFRLNGLEEAPSAELLFRPEAPAPTHLSDREVSSAVLRLTRIRNRIRALDAIEDDFERPIRDRLAAARSGMSLTRQAVELIEQLRDRAPNPRDPRISRLSNELLHAACDDPNTSEVMHQNHPEWVASVVRLYHGVAEGAIRAAYSERGETGVDNRIFQARLHLLRARRAAYALRLSDAPVEAAAVGADLNRDRSVLMASLTRETGRIVRNDVREARRLLARADAVLGRPHGRVSEARVESARADYRRGVEILNRLSEFSGSDRRVLRLREDRRWARLETAAGAAAA